MRYSEINEARRNPEVNKKTFALDALKKYEGKGYFASFTYDVGAASHGSGNFNKTHPRGEFHNASGHKIGVNPQFDYNTPIGVYGYPVDYIIREKMDVEFGGERPFIQVIAPTTDKILYAHEVTEELYDSIKATLQEWYPDFYYETSHFSKLHLSWMICHCATIINRQRTGHVFGHLLRRLGYEAVIDYDPATGKGMGFIHNHEPTQGVFLTPKAYKHVETIHNIQVQTDYSKVTEFVKCAKQGNMVVDDKMFQFFIRHSAIPMTTFDHIIRSASDDDMAKIATFFENNPNHLSDIALSSQGVARLNAVIDPSLTAAVEERHSK